MTAAVSSSRGRGWPTFAQHVAMDYLQLENRISARLPDKDVAELLSQSVLRPALLVTSVNVDTMGDRVTLTENNDDS
jgi:GntR family phosphonate transport system transcriptional regulator